MAFGHEIKHAREKAAGGGSNRLRQELAKANEATKLANSEANKAYDIAVEATKEKAKNAHIAAQNKHLITVEKVVSAYESCKATNEFNQKVHDLTGVPLVTEDCLKKCTDFNSLIDTYNTDNKFVGDMAFAHAECN